MSEANDNRWLVKHDDERMHIHKTEQENDYIEEMEMTSCSNHMYLDILSNDTNSESTILERLSLLFVNVE